MTEKKKERTLPDWAREYTEGGRSDDGVLDCISPPYCDAEGVRRGLAAFDDLVIARQQERQSLFPED
jgi:hypothetical protein